MKFKLVEKFLNESALSMDMLKKRYGGNGLNIENICWMDPTTQGVKPGKYCEWLIKNFIAAKTDSELQKWINDHDSDKVFDLLNAFDIYKTYHSNRYININEFDTIRELTDFYYSILDTLIHEIKKSDIKEATLLTEEQAKKINRVYLRAYSQWWLRSKGGKSCYTATVDSEGIVYHNGTPVTSSFGVRPALILRNPESLNIKIGESCEINGAFFRCVLPGILLSLSSAGTCPFRTKEHCIEMSDCKNDAWMKEDKPYKEYEGSDVEKFVEDWFENL